MDPTTTTTTVETGMIMIVIMTHHGKTPMGAPRRTMHHHDII
jgi:hypothetical protein